MNDSDVLSDEGLAAIEALVPKMAQDFELAINNAWARSVQAHFKWTTPADVMARADSIYALVEGAMCVSTLCKNLRAERANKPWTVDETLGTYRGEPPVQPTEDTMVVPRSFVESVMYSGSFEGEDLQKLWAQAEELLT